MPTLTDAVASMRRRARRARAALGDLAPVGATVGRPVDGQTPPPPRAFARFGDGSWVVPASLVRNPHLIAIGVRTIILEHSVLIALDDASLASGPRLVVGDDVRLTRYNTIVCGSAEVVLGNGVASSDGATVLGTWRDGLRPAATLAGLPVPDDAPVVIGAGAYLGCNSVVWPGVTIGEGAYVSEGAVVVGDVPAHTVVAGNPATVVRRYDAAHRTWRGS
jgi:acetyltransferase-like isoleucine patch superfamily enzyme